jgi:hypothetical protein
MRPYLVLALVAACGSEPDADARLAERRAALGTKSEPMPFADAMKRIEAQGYEGLLARVGSKRLSRDEVLDAAVEIESLLARADPSTAEARPPDPPDFDAQMKNARGRAAAFARAVAKGGTGEVEARELFASCQACHVTFRTPR